MKINRFTIDDENSELMIRFLSLREQIYGEDYFYYPEAEIHRQLFGYYGMRPDYDFNLLLAETSDGVDVGRVLVGRCDRWPWAFFGFFECPDDPQCLESLMEAAGGVAADLGAVGLKGPIELNTFHNWMFLCNRDTSERWVGDPYHLPHYPRLFEKAGWEIAEQAVSGIFRPEEHERLVAKGPSAAEGLHREGYRIAYFGELPEETILTGIWEIVKDNFSPRFSLYVPIDLELFRAIHLPLLRSVEDPCSIIAIMKDDTMAGFAVSYSNFIERLCNPDGTKTRPESGSHTPTIFALKTMAVAGQFRGGPAYSGMMTTLAEHMQRTYGHHLAWRRTNIENPGTRKIQEASEITQTYATYSRGLS